MTEKSGLPARPWYHEFWPWALMLPPLVAVAGGVMMLWLAIDTPNALVVDDYAHIEEITNERFERDRLAASLGVEAEVVFDAAAMRIEATVTGRPPFAQPAALRLRLQHATDPTADRELALLPDHGRFVVATALPAGRYRLELMPIDLGWRLGADVVHLDGAVWLKAQAAAN
jgi:uncharacterized protein